MVFLLQESRNGPGKGKKEKMVRIEFLRAKRDKEDK